MMALQKKADTIPSNWLKISFSWKGGWKRIKAALALAFNGFFFCFFSSWEVFVEAASLEDETEREAAMYQAISGLALPNRDTLAYIILHLKCVADHKDKNKMDMDNLSKVMGPTIVGYSSSDPTAILSEAEDQRQVMQTLLNISDE